MSAAAPSTSSTGRKLIGAPILLQDWDEEAEEGAAKYWELFLDLLLVAAASSVADQFQENLHLSGFCEFSVLYLIIVNGWLLYTHHITTRFEDSSLAHSLVLFVYFVGFGCCIVNADLEDARAFSVGALLQRASVLVMLATTACCIPRARYFCAALSIVTGLAMAGLGVSALGDDRVVTMIGLWIAGGVEFLAEVFMTRALPGRRLVPVNIEHSKDRLGALELVMLGETVLSVTITYREKKKEEIVEGQESYYMVLTLSFLLIFMFTLLFFHMQPLPREHAFRRSRMHGSLLLLAHKVLGLALLTVGVSVKLVVEAVLLEESLSPFASRLMGLSVGAALAILFLMRYLHYGGKSEIHFGHKTLRKGDYPELDRILHIWWWTVGTAWMLPFLGIATGVTTGDPLLSTALHAGLLFVVCVLESTYTHTLENVIPEPSPAAEDRSEELQGLMTSSTASKSYQGTS